MMRQFERRRRGNAGAGQRQFGRSAALAHTAHLVRAPPVVAGHLGAFAENVPGGAAQPGVDLQPQAQRGATG